MADDGNAGTLLDSCLFCAAGWHGPSTRAPPLPSPPPPPEGARPVRFQFNFLKTHLTRPDACYRRRARDDRKIYKLMSLCPLTAGFFSIVRKGPESHCFPSYFDTRVRDTVFSGINECCIFKKVRIYDNFKWRNNGIKTETISWKKLWLQFFFLA